MDVLQNLLITRSKIITAIFCIFKANNKITIVQKKRHLDTVISLHEGIVSLFKLHKQALGLNPK